MCRFPGLLTIGGLLIVLGAALMGLAPASEVSASSASPEPVRITLRADSQFDSFLPQSLFSESPRPIARTQEKNESPALPRIAKQVHFEVATTSEGEETGPPFRR